MIQEIQIFQELSGEMIFLFSCILREQVSGFFFFFVALGEGSFFLGLKATSFFSIS